MANDNIRFHELLDSHLMNVLKPKFLNETLTPKVLREIHSLIRSTIEGIFMKSSQVISGEALSWLTDQYFKNIKVNDTQHVSDLVVLNEYVLDELKYTDIQLLCNLFSDHRIGHDLEIELRKRS